MPRTLLVVNPQASAVSEERAARVAEALRTAGEVETVWTEGPGHATELVRDADADALVVFAGDGGFNEALNGLRFGLPVGFIPGGGSSVLPRALGIPLDPAAAGERVADALRAGRARRISLGRVNGRRFGFAAGLGFPGEIVRRVDERGRADGGRRPPDRAFLAAVLRALAERRWRLDPAIDIPGHGRASFALVANCDPYTYLGRLPIRAVPRARFDGGLDVVAPGSVRPAAVPRLAAAALLARSPRARGVLYLHDVEEIELRADRPLPLQVDGEDLGDVAVASFSAEREAADVLV